MNNIIPAFSDSLFRPLLDVGKDVLELTIDSMLEEKWLKDIPIVGAVVGVGNVFINLHERNLLKQTLVFIQELNSGNIEEEKLKKYKKKIKENQMEIKQELNRVLIILNRNIDEYKSKMEAKFFKAYVNEEIIWDEFCEYCDITERLFMSDIDDLKEAYRVGGVTANMKIYYRHDRLMSLGLLENELSICGGSKWKIFPERPENTKVLKMTELGHMFCKMGF